MKNTNLILLATALVMLLSCSQPITEVGSHINQEAHKKIKETEGYEPFPPQNGGQNWQHSTYSKSAPTSKVYNRPPKVPVTHDAEVDILDYGGRWQGGTYDGHKIIRWHYHGIWPNKWISTGQWSGYLKVYNRVTVQTGETWGSVSNFRHDLGYISPTVVKYNDKYYMYYTEHWREYSKQNEYTNYTNRYASHFQVSYDNGVSWTQGSINTGALNPNVVFNTDGSPQVESGIIFSNFLEADGFLKLWYMGKDNTSRNGYWRLFYAHTLDSNASVWTTKSDMNRDMINSVDVSPRGFDSTAIGKSSVVRSSGMYEMWYTGYDELEDRYSIGYADSENSLRDWRKSGAPIFSGTPGKFDAKGVADPAVIKEGSIYKMWYAGFDGEKWQLGLAYSWNGKNFFYHSESNYVALPIMTTPEETAKYDIRYPTVVRDGDKYRIWYSYRLSGQRQGNLGLPAPWKIGYAESPIEP